MDKQKGGNGISPTNKIRGSPAEYFMKTYQNLILVGTSHIAQESIETITNVIEQQDPEVIAVELDKRRAAALFMKRERGVRLSDIGRVGIKGFFFALIGGWAEKKLGESVGMKPGEDMKTAIAIAKQRKKRISFIDQEIEVTLRKLSKRISWKEKWNFITDMIGSVFSKKKRLEFDLHTVPDQKVISKMIKKVKKRYPNIYDVLIVERNAIMARSIAKLMVRFPHDKILAVVGAGHEEEILGLVRKNLDHGVVYSMNVSFGRKTI